MKERDPMAVRGSQMALSKIGDGRTFSCRLQDDEKQEDLAVSELRILLHASLTSALISRISS